MEFVAPELNIQIGEILSTAQLTRLGLSLSITFGVSGQSTYGAHNGMIFANAGIGLFKRIY